jgi:signal transduction histidine kinase/ActR/RegA family two-component response regulator
MLRPDGSSIPASKLAGVRALTENQVIENLEMGMVKTDGEITWLSVTAAPLPLPGYGVVIAYTDITERKQAEQMLQLQAERERLMGLITQRIRQSLHLDEILQTTVEEVRQLLQDDRVLLFQLCSDGVGRVVTESMSPGLPAIVGREFPDERFPEACYQAYYQGQPRVVPDITQDELAPCLVEFLQQLGVKSKLVIPILCSSQRGEKGDGDMRYRLATATQNAEISLWGVMVAHDCTGHRQWQPWEIALLTSLATQIGIAIQQCELYLQLGAKLSDLQQTEAALQQAKEAAEVANRAKSEFLANMSHELRTPLNGILGYAQILKKDTNLSDEQRNSLSIIHQCGEHLLTLINDILDLSKIEASRMELFPTEFHFPNFLNSLADLFKMRAQQRNIAFTYQICSPLPQGVMADQKRLRQVLSNLLSNAVKFTDEGGVTFRVSDVGVESGNEYTATSPSPILNSQFPIPKIRFQIEDTGIGIEPSQLAELFLPFHQVSDRAHAVEGTGLGLAISQKLVQMMGSQIQVKSSLAQGSVFWFDLELPSVTARAEPNSSCDRRIVGFKGHKRKVLTIDDHPVNCSFLRDLLQPLGFEMFEAVDGQEGLNKAQQTQPDLILMDLVMPGLDGLEATRRLRQLPQFQDVVVIALSANVRETSKQESLAAGCQDFLPKPVQAQQLLNLLTVHLGLEWIYDEDLSPTGVESNPECAPLVLPPTSELTTLSELVRMGDIQEILHRVEQLETLDEKFEQFVAKIRQLAKEFKLKQLQKLIQHYLD